MNGPFVVTIEVTTKYRVQIDDALELGFEEDETIASISGGIGSRSHELHG